ncbi:hypothetical protein CONPUDRAFT_151565 [Coniophora puteana RWD-64-598 SS2]|uniref:Uncharacterized protein n=1 Tax=Coniophora puteana (strain RWD-64-598) TaxID=741705 RepID=A0A5M3MZJ3_CONPW|nr:uncharacterized protein CONPUDRAFT_151565 [Coniophora puteana RWD-64-598 SS2]EIW84549.1 hypothetical protein CONPUDRAFT_151565 [Coniophora puteana RWD-64-598 SS2]
MGPTLRDRSQRHTQSASSRTLPRTVLQQEQEKADVTKSATAPSRTRKGKTLQSSSEIPSASAQLDGANVSPAVPGVKRARSRKTASTSSRTKTALRSDSVAAAEEAMDPSSLPDPECASKPSAKTPVQTGVGSADPSTSGTASTSGNLLEIAPATLAVDCLAREAHLPLATSLTDPAASVSSPTSENIPRPSSPASPPRTPPPGKALRSRGKVPGPLPEPRKPRPQKINPDSLVEQARIRHEAQIIAEGDASDPMDVDDDDDDQRVEQLLSPPSHPASSTSTDNHPLGSASAQDPDPGQDALRARLQDKIYDSNHSQDAEERRALLVLHQVPNRSDTARTQEQVVQFVNDGGGAEEHSVALALHQNPDNDTIQSQDNDQDFGGENRHQDVSNAAEEMMQVDEAERNSSPPTPAKQSSWRESSPDDSDEYLPPGSVPKSRKRYQQPNQRDKHTNTHEDSSPDEDQDSSRVERPTTRSKGANSRRKVPKSRQQNHTSNDMSQEQTRPATPNTGSTDTGNTREQQPINTEMSQDAEDQEPANARRQSRKARKNSASRRKKAGNIKASQDHDDEGNGEADGDEKSGDDRYVPGPLPAAICAELADIGAEIMAEVHKRAQQLRKPADTIMEAMGISIPHERETSLYNMFLCWQKARDDIPRAAATSTEQDESSVKKRQKAEQHFAAIREHWEEVKCKDFSSSGSGPRPSTIVTRECRRLCKTAQLTGGMNNLEIVGLVIHKGGEDVPAGEAGFFASSNHTLQVFRERGVNIQGIVDYMGAVLTMTDCEGKHKDVPMPDPFLTVKSLASNPVRDTLRGIIREMVLVKLRAMGSTTKKVGWKKLMPKCIANGWMWKFWPASLSHFPIGAEDFDPKHLGTAALWLLVHAYVKGTRPKVDYKWLKNSVLKEVDTDADFSDKTLVQFDRQALRRDLAQAPEIQLIKWPESWLERLQDDKQRLHIPLVVLTENKALLRIQNVKMKFTKKQRLAKSKPSGSRKPAKPSPSVEADTSSSGESSSSSEEDEGEDRVHADKGKQQDLGDIEDIRDLSSSDDDMLPEKLSQVDSAVPSSQSCGTQSAAPVHPPQPAPGHKPQPAPPRAPQPAASRASEPAPQSIPSRVSQPASARASQPASSRASQPASSRASQPAPSRAPQAASARASQPALSRSSQPPLPCRAPGTAAPDVLPNPVRPSVSTPSQNSRRALSGLPSQSTGGPSSSLAAVPQGPPILSPGVAGPSSLADVNSTMPMGVRRITPQHVYYGLASRASLPQQSAGIDRERGSRTAQSPSHSIVRGSSGGYARRGPSAPPGRGPIQYYGGEADGFSQGFTPYGGYGAPAYPYSYGYPPHPPFHGPPSFQAPMGPPNGFPMYAVHDQIGDIAQLGEEPEWLDEPNDEYPTGGHQMQWESNEQMDV